MADMRDPASFFRQRASACFHRRRKYPVNSDDWLHEVNSARRFVAAYRGLVEGDLSSEQPSPVKPTERYKRNEPT
jgi:hypothetical protein